jgi:midasin
VVEEVEGVPMEEDDDSRRGEEDPMFSQHVFPDAPLHSNLLNVCGIVLRRQAVTATTTTNSTTNTNTNTNSTVQVVHNRMVETETTRGNVSRFAQALCHGDPILLEGPPGCGKTSMLRHVAHHLRSPPIVELHIDDQMDIKTLLGTYVCTDLPGEFNWQPGVLTQAVTAGRWVVIDDIDRAPFDVLSALTHLIENNTLILPGETTPITAAPSFRLFATRTGGGR